MKSIGTRGILAAWLLAGGIATAARAGEADAPLPVALVQALNHLAGGPHPGYRANHAKGLLVQGTFTPAAGASKFSKAPHFARRVPVLVRFSDATGVPELPDADPNASPHGMAIRFQLPGGAATDIVAISANGFPVATPEDFLALLQAAGASGAGAPSPRPIETFLGTHPAAARFLSTPRPPPQSFATLAFYGVNAFKFTNAAGVSRFARYRILPVAGEHALAPGEATAAGPNYLMEELPRRIAHGPVTFRLLAQVARDGDPIVDPTAVWSDDHETVALGTLSLARVPADQAGAQRKLLFNPLALAPGIEASDDPVLHIRPAAYGVSYAQRVQ